MLSQLTVFLQNEKGSLAGMCRTLADAGIDMKALFVADTQDYGIARIFCDTPNAAAEALREAGFRARITNVLGVRLSNEPGGLAKLLEFLDAQDVNIEYAYCFSAGADFACDALKIDAESTGGRDVEALLREAGFTPIAPGEMYRLD